MTAGRELTLATLALAAIACVASAQRTSLTEPQFQDFRIDYVNGDLFLESEYRDRNDSSGDSDTVENTNTIFREGINLNSAGSVYHPNFLQWQASGKFGLIQERSETRSATEDDERSSDGDLLGYNLDGLFFREKPFSMHVFSLYDKNTITRDFAEPLDYELSRNGVELRHRGELQSKLLMEYSTDYEKSDVNETDEKTWLGRFTTGQNKPDRFQWEFTAQHEDTTEESGTSTLGDDQFDRQRDELTLDHFYEWGDDRNPSSVSGSIAYTDQRGFYDTQTAFIDETLTLGHTPTFSTFYRAHYDQTRTPGFEGDDVDANETFISGEAGYRKMFYQSLEAIGRVFIEDRQFEGGSEEALGVEQDLRYTKKTPVGPYRSNLLVRRSWESEKSDSGVRRIVGEDIALSDGTFVALGVPAVLPGSLRVFNQSRTRLYREGIDYITRQTGEFTEIARLIGSDDPIDDGEVVAVDYSAVSLGDVDFTNDRISWTQALTIDSLALTLYSRVRYIDESPTSGTDPGNLEELSSVLGGIEYAKYGLTLAYEYEVLDTKLGIPHTLHRVRGRYDTLIGDDLRLSLGATAEFVEYNLDEEDLTGDPDRDEDYLTTYTAFAEAVERLNRYTLIRLRGRFLQSDGRSDLVDTEISAAMEWEYRELEMAVEGRYRVFEQEESDGDVATLLFTLKRYF